MARKKAKKEVSRKEINGNIIITFDDGSIQIIPAPIELSSEEASSILVLRKKRKKRKKKRKKKMKKRKKKKKMKRKKMN